MAQIVFKRESTNYKCRALTHLTDRRDAMQYAFISSFSADCFDAKGFSRHKNEHFCGGEKTWLVVVVLLKLWRTAVFFKKNNEKVK